MQPVTIALAARLQPPNTHALQGDTRTALASPDMRNVQSARLGALAFLPANPPTSCLVRLGIIVPQELLTGRIFRAPLELTRLTRTYTKAHNAQVALPAITAVVAAAPRQGHVHKGTTVQ